ncbi:MAG: PD-(D/E)XK nuclease-like domain-containing protein [Chitinophagaceae bacterium]|nr:PD-(D/E)XK nuclease-like domain-containing protein [Rubrivivax sp.]
MTESATTAVASPQGATLLRQAAGSADAPGVPALTQSIAKVLLAKSPLHAWTEHPRLNPDYVAEEKDEFDFGEAAHDLLLEGGTGKICVIKPEDYRSKPTKANPEGGIPKGWTNGAIRAARDDARKNRLVPILPWHEAQLLAMVKVARECINDSEIAEAWNGGTSEVKLHWQEGSTHCRGRIDRLSHARNIIFDYKSTNNANPEAFLRTIINLGYDVQDAFYRRGISAETKRDPKFVFLAQEREAPFACSLVALDPAMQEMADRKVSFAMALWARCMETGRWSAYGNRIHYVEPPVWYAAQAEDIDFDNMDEMANP